MAAEPRAWHLKRLPTLHSVPKTIPLRPPDPDASHKPDRPSQWSKVGEQRPGLSCHAPPARSTAESVARIPNPRRWSLRPESTTPACVAVPEQAQSAVAVHQIIELHDHPPLYQCRAAIL